MSGNGIFGSAREASTSSTEDKTSVSWVCWILTLLGLKDKHASDTTSHISSPRNKDSQPNMESVESDFGKERNEGLRLPLAVDPGLHKVNVLANSEPAESDEERWSIEWDEPRVLLEWVQEEGVEMLMNLPEDLVAEVEAASKAEDQNHGSGHRGKDSPNQARSA
ncbi:hypothetical protein FALBO_5745 [Fusarium albosuccineum]|uniref:Uncharacterized protein n=1 Tax=Fusarium albosuccineum TaxID=1237068 RepID=A0A8H4LG71_9HYPO|nr:hypothetical protein FALBO_5745 [Fusarium albosuccineum]